MPIKIPNDLPAKDILKNEKIFIMDEDRAFHQDIRPLKIAILNLMPTKEVTEVQILRLLSNSSLQVGIVLLHPKTHISKNTSQEHLVSFHNTFDEIKGKITRSWCIFSDFKGWETDFCYGTFRIRSLNFNGRI